MEPVKNGKPKARPCKALSKISPETVKDDKAKKELPILLDVLLPMWEAGIMTRQPGRMSIRPDGGSWQVTLEAPTEGVQAVFMCDSLSTLLVEVEAVLASGRTHWGMSWQKRRKNLPTIDDVIQ